MKKLNSLQQLIYRLGGALIILGALLNPLQSAVSPYVYSVGAILFASMQLLARYEGESMVIRRLRRQQIFGALLLLASGALMFGQQYRLMYMRRNEWLIVMLIAAVFELYTAFRIPNEIDKEKSKNAT